MTRSLPARPSLFRVQMAERQLCPSSPHARLGFDCARVAGEAWGLDARMIGKLRDALRAGETKENLGDPSRRQNRA
jgi:hypothetical protein